MKRQIILEHRLAPGDVTVTTSVVRDIKLKYGKDIDIDFRTNFPAIYEYNPHLTPLEEGKPGVEKIILCYKQGLISSGTGNRHHFTTWFHRDFANKAQLPVEPLFSKPDLHLSDYEKNTRPIDGRYWLVFGGGKPDITIKHWDYTWYQSVVDKLLPFGIRFAQSGATKDNHTHPPMKNVLNIVGWGYVRELMWQIYHCDGVVCPVTCAMHMAAAFEKPCVVIAGGREEPWWEAYTNNGQFGEAAAPVKVPHRFLHTVGLLDCCSKKGCWRHQVTKGSRICTKLANRPLGIQPLPLCMDMITPNMVVDAVLSYYEDGTLPPIAAETTTKAPVKKLMLPRLKNA